MRLRVNATRNCLGSVVYFVERRRRFLGIPYWSEVENLYPFMRFSRSGVPLIRRNGYPQPPKGPIDHPAE